MLARDNKITVIDFGAYNTKIMMGKVKDKIIHIDKYDIIPTPDFTIREGRIINKDSMVSFISKMKIRSKDIRIVLSSDDVVLRNFDFPKLDKDELMEAVKFEMSILLPEKVDKYIVDYYILDEFSKVNDDNEVPMQKIQGVAISKSIVRNYINCFAKAGYKISIVDIQSNCVNKLFCSNENYIRTKDNIAILDIGHEKTTITFIEDRKVFMHRVLGGGSGDITKIISNILDIDKNSAEMWKRKNDFSFLISDLPNKEPVAEEITKYCHDITQELYQIIEFFISMSVNKSLDEIYIIGGGALLPHIHQYIEKYINIRTQRIDMLEKIKFSTQESQDDISIITNSLGAFIRRG